jgi:hypothetical protein
LAAAPFAFSAATAGSGRAGDGAGDFMTGLESPLPRFAQSC